MTIPNHQRLYLLSWLRPQQPLADRRPARLSQASWLESPGTDTVAHDCNGNLCAETRNGGLRKDSRGRANCVFQDREKMPSQFSNEEHLRLMAEHKECLAGPGSHLRA